MGSGQRPLWSDGVMRQIYYTQCPIGYGLGATSGFQIKRLDSGYPTSGDFRHLALRAFLPGSRDLAPPALRYRRVGDVAEVAWLTPRTHEYETEGGRLWGRPGGQFAHGLRLDPEELAALRHWPAGLHGRPFWVRSDPERTSGRPPKPLGVGVGDLLAPPTFEAIAPLAEPFDGATLARLLASLARVTREGRTLVVIADAEALWRLAAVLTFAFPEPLRAELTFSTYHDRPEELSGFRFQGTIPAARPNRAVLSGLGIVADLAAGSGEPVADLPSWSRTLSAWLLARDASGAAAWGRTAGRLTKARIPVEVAERWSDDWLDHLFGFDDQTRTPTPVPTDRHGWAGLVGFVKWSARHGLDAEWANAHDPPWWRQAHGPDRPPVEARAALVAQGRLPESWRPAARGAAGASAASAGERAAEWGDVTAFWFARSDHAEQAEAASRMLRSAPKEIQGAFLAALVRGLDEESGGFLIEHLARDPAFDRSLLLPVEASRLVVGGETSALTDTLDEALRTPAATASTLAAVAEAVGGRGEIREPVARVLADVLARGDLLPGWGRAWCWGLGRDDALEWLGPFLEHALTHPDLDPGRDSLVARTPDDQRPALARCVIDAARRPGLPVGALLWGVDHLLLPLDPGARPHDPAWADALLERLTGLDLVRRLYLKGTRERPLAAWLAEAGRRGEIGPGQAARLRMARDFAAALDAGDAAFLKSVELPEVPEAERGGLLDLMLRFAAGTTFEGVLRCLDIARRDWGLAAFGPGSASVGGIAEALSGPPARYVEHPDRWIEAVEQILERLGLRDGPLGGFEPDGLAAHLLVFATGAGDEIVDPWPLRNAVFGRDDAWRCLLLTVCRDLPARDPKALARGLSRWNDGLKRGSGALESRFHELLGNAADRSGPWALRKVVSERASELRTLDRSLRWWACDTEPGARDDLRDAFARRVPIAPLPPDAFHEVRRWFSRSEGHSELELDLVPDDRRRGPDRPVPEPGHYPYLSEIGWARWLCLEALTVAARPGLTSPARWQSVESWRTLRLPLGRLNPDDRHRFVAEVIHLLDDYDPGEIAQERRVSELARWLAEAGVHDLSRVRDWGRDLATLASSELIRARRPLVGALTTCLREELESRNRREGRLGEDRAL